MKPEPTDQQIIAQFETMRHAGLTFEVAKQKLLDQGIAESRIGEVTDEYDYNDPRPVSDIPLSVETYYKAHPAQATVAADGLAKAAHKEGVMDARNQALTDALGEEGAGAFGVQGADAQTEYEGDFAYEVDMSFWLLFVIQIGLNIGVFVLVTYLNIPGWGYVINLVLGLILALFLIRRIK